MTLGRRSRVGRVLASRKRSCSQAQAGFIGQSIADAFSRAAEKLGLEMAGDAGWSENAASYRDVARQVERSGADAVLLAGPLAANGARLVRDLRAVLGPGVKHFATGVFALPAQEIGRAAEGMDR